LHTDIFFCFYLPIFQIMVLFIKKKQRQTIIQTFYFIIFSFLIKFLILKLFFAYNDPCNRLSSQILVRWKTYNTLPENFDDCARSGTTSGSGITTSVIYIVIKIFELSGKNVILWHCEFGMKNWWEWHGTPIKSSFLRTWKIIFWKVVLPNEWIL
jgi:hypothetical protein